MFSIFFLFLQYTDYSSVQLPEMKGNVDGVTSSPFSLGTFIVTRWIGLSGHSRFHEGYRPRSPNFDRLFKYSHCSQDKLEVSYRGRNFRTLGSTNWRRSYVRFEGYSYRHSRHVGVIDTVHLRYVTVSTTVK